jgi:hypothetical protein
MDVLSHASLRRKCHTRGQCVHHRARLLKTRIRMGGSACRQNLTRRVATRGNTSLVTAPANRSSSRGMHHLVADLVYERCQGGVGKVGVGRGRWLVHPRRTNHETCVCALCLYHFVHMACKSTRRATARRPAPTKRSGGANRAEHGTGVQVLCGTLPNVRGGSLFSPDQAPRANRSKSVEPAAGRDG